MAHRYSTDDEILRNIALLVPMSGWPREGSVLARLAEAVRPRGFNAWAALWPDGTACTLIVSADHGRPPSEQILRAYRQYHDRRQAETDFCLDEGRNAPVQEGA